MKNTLRSIVLAGGLGLTSLLSGCAAIYLFGENKQTGKRENYENRHEERNEDEKKIANNEYKSDRKDLYK